MSQFQCNKARVRRLKYSPDISKASSKKYLANIWLCLAVVSARLLTFAAHFVDEF
jgi:hypothetical protein